MRVRFLLFLLFFLLAFFPKGRTQTMLTAEQQRSDLAVLKFNLEQFHPGLYRYTSKDSMDFFFRQTEKKIQAQSLIAFYGQVTTMLNKIHCGHTRSRLPNEFYESFERDQLFIPLTLTSVANRVLVKDAFLDLLFRGDEIRSVNGKPIGDILKQISAHLSADGFITTGIRKQAMQWFNFYYQLYVEPDSTCYVLELCRQDGTVKQVTMNGVQWSTLQIPAVPEPVMSLTYSSRYAVLTLKTFDSGSIRQAGFSYNEFLEQSFSALIKRKVNNLILDLRGNGGGDDNYGATLVSYLANRPFRYFDRIEVTDAYDGYGNVVKKNGHNLMTSHEGLREWEPQRNRFKGNVYVLIDGGSFSTCADVAAVLHHNKWATFVGEETGGGYDGNTSGYTKRLQLPNSRINVSIPMWKYTTANVGHAYGGRGMQPDYFVQPTMQQFLERTDPEMEKVKVLMGIRK